MTPLLLNVGHHYHGAIRIPVRGWCVFSAPTKAVAVADFRRSAPAGMQVEHIQYAGWSWLYVSPVTSFELPFRVAVSVLELAPVAGGLLEEAQQGPGPLDGCSPGALDAAWLLTSTSKPWVIAVGIRRTLTTLTLADLAEYGILVKTLSGSIDQIGDFHARRAVRSCTKPSYTSSGPR